MMEEERSSVDFVDNVLCFPGARLYASEPDSIHSTDGIVVFINAGGEGDDKYCVKSDEFFEGGNAIKTEEFIDNSGYLTAIYQTARFGNFCYVFHGIPPGDYVVDILFAEIVNTKGPRGMRVFNVFIQHEKVMNELDVYSIVGANKSLRVVDIKVVVMDDGELKIRFQGVIGSPIVNGICVRRAMEESLISKTSEYLKCYNCAAELAIPSEEVLKGRSLTKYEEQIKELRFQCQKKAKECHEAWMSLASVSQQLERVRSELDTMFLQNMSLDQAMKEKTESLDIISNQREHDKRVWTAAFIELERKVKILKTRQSELSNEAHECASSIPNLNKMIGAIQCLVTQYDELKLKFNDEQMKRKELHNQLQEAKGNIRVFCRCRPISKKEELAGYQTVVDFSSAVEGDITIMTNCSTKKKFKFDRVFTHEDDQAVVYIDASPIVMSILDGYNACIFAYGQTGTGKTFTMEGSEHNRGVNYRTLDELFNIIEERKDTTSYDISVSVLEVYNEQIRDLLASSSTAKRLAVKQRYEGLNLVPGLTEAKVENVKEAWDVLQAGSNARAVGSNNVNEHSSRSHCLLCTFVRAQNLFTGECTLSKLWLVDLAGSERLTKTDVQGERLKEAQNINRSLSALGDVISALSAKSSHIPYRNSKLTHLLQDSLGGDSKTLMFVQISPSDHDIGETLSSLNFASRVRRVELGPIKKQIDTAELQKIKSMLEKAKQDLRNKDETIHKLELNIQRLESNVNQKDLLRESQHEKYNELEAQLSSKTQSCRQLEKQSGELFESVKEKEAMCQHYQRETKRLEDRLKVYEQVDTADLLSQVKEFESRFKVRSHELENKIKKKVDEYDKRIEVLTLNYESHSIKLEKQVKVLESELSRERQNTEDCRRKMHILEEKLRQQEEKDPLRSLSADWTISSASKTPCQMNLPLCLRDLNNSSEQTFLPREISGVLNGQKPSRDSLVKLECENNPLPFSPQEKTSLEGPNKVIKQGPSKRSFAKITRIHTKPPVSTQRTHKNITNTGGSAKDGQIISTTKKQRVWLR